jgi:hypothetical protein
LSSNRADAVGAAIALGANGNVVLMGRLVRMLGYLLVLLTGGIASANFRSRPGSPAVDRDRCSLVTGDAGGRDAGR